MSAYEYLRKSKKMFTNLELAVLYYGENPVDEREVKDANEAAAELAALRQVLEALENIADDLDKHGGPQWRGSPMEQAARAAIAKATGEHDPA